MLQSVDQLDEGNFVNLEADHARRLIADDKAVAIDAADWPAPPAPVGPSETKPVEPEEHKEPIPFVTSGAKKKATRKS